MDKMITDNMIINLNMFSSFIKKIIVSNMNSTLVIITKRNNRECGHTQILEKPSKLEELGCGISKNTIFCFSAGVGHNSLFLTLPRDHERECPLGIENYVRQQHNELIVELIETSSPGEQHKKCLDK